MVLENVSVSDYGRTDFTVDGIEYFFCKDPQCEYGTCISSRKLYDELTAVTEGTELDETLALATEAIEQSEHLIQYVAYLVAENIRLQTVVDESDAQIEFFENLIHDMLFAAVTGEGR